MRHRRDFLSVCLIGAAFGADGVAQTLGRLASPAARRHDMSYGSWTDLPDGWGYFPPSGIMDRQRMLFWADRIRAEAAALERRLGTGRRIGQVAAELEAVRAVRVEAEAFRHELLFGSHMADFRPRLVALAAAFEAAAIRESANLEVKRWVETGERDVGKITAASGPWPRSAHVSRHSGIRPEPAEAGGKRSTGEEAEVRSLPRP